MSLTSGVSYHRKIAAFGSVIVEQRSSELRHEGPKGALASVSGVDLTGPGPLLVGGFGAPKPTSSFLAGRGAKDSFSTVINAHAIAYFINIYFRA